MPLELAADLVKLSLFDTVLYVDDSGSMAFEEGGERIDDLKLYVCLVCLVTVIPIDGPRESTVVQAWLVTYLQMWPGREWRGGGRVRARTHVRARLTIWWWLDGPEPVGKAWGGERRRQP